MAAVEERGGESKVRGKFVMWQLMGEPRIGSAIIGMWEKGLRTFCGMEFNPLDTCITQPALTSQ